MSKCYYCGGCRGGCPECQKPSAPKAEVPSPNEVKPVEVSKPKMYGFVSMQYLGQGYITHLYQYPNGDVVSVCWIESTPNTTTAWTDAECIGEVIEWSGE